MKLLYLAGPYTGNVDQNIIQAAQISVELWKKGFAVICPHLNTAYFEQDGIEYETFLEGDKVILERVDAVIMLPGWWGSNGACVERYHALAKGIPVYEYPEHPPRS